MLVLSLCLFAFPLTNEEAPKSGTYSVANIIKAFKELSWQKKAIVVGATAGTVGAAGFFAHKGVKAVQNSAWVKKLQPVQKQIENQVESQVKQLK